MTNNTTYLNVIARPEADHYRRMIYRVTQRRRAGYEKRFTQLFKTVLNKQYKLLAQSIDSTNYKDSSIVNNIERWPIEWAMIELYKTVGSAFAGDSYRNLKTEAGEMLTKEDMEDVWYERMINHVKTEGTLKIVSITAESCELARKIIRQILEHTTLEGLGADQTARLMKKALISEGIEINQWRSLRIVRTEVVSASNYGAMVGAEATGLPMEKYWIPTYDNRTRDTHLSIASQNPKDMNDKFQVGAYMMSYPGSPEGGPEEVINCRCAIAHGVKRIQNIKP